ncbi:DUF7701 domain-containing protein [Lacisediminihabitans sp.]|uniref:DUF7701 domain-containing protein n=1 Tax=Lacisediminihabitans sp. TaxID=2787631 RepID=UPI003BB99674
MNYLDQVASEIKQAIPAELRPDNDAQVLYRLYALLVLTRGVETTLANVHDAWSVWMLGREPSHESLVPFESLPEKVRQEDEPYQRAIVVVARARTVRT